MSNINTINLDTKKYPVLAFRFEVNFTFTSSSGTNTYTSSFQSISNISKSTKVTKIANGGDNFSEYHLPSHIAYKDITLKRGIMKSFGEDYPLAIVNWFEDLGWDSSNKGRRIWPCTIQIILKDTDKDNNIIDKMMWTLYHAYPTSVKLGEFNSQKSEVAVETITLAYSNYERQSLNQ